MPAWKSYEGLTVGYCTLIENPGPNDGRRTTHWARCEITGKRLPLPIRKNTIQQAIRLGRRICPFCPRPERRCTRVSIGDHIAGVVVCDRLPAGRTYSGKAFPRWLVECPDKKRFPLNGHELCRALDGKRQSKFTCGQECANFEWPKPRGWWDIKGPATAPCGKETSEQLWWRVQCTAPSRDGESCGRISVKSTSDINNARGGSHCGCYTSHDLSEYHCRHRDPLDVLLVKKLVKGVKKTCRPQVRKRRVPFKLAFSRCMALFFARCVYCGREPFQQTNIEVIPGKRRVMHLGRLKHGGLDRVRPTLGYTARNTVPACKDCNFFKGAQELSAMRERLKRIVERAPELLSIPADKRDRERLFKGIFLTTPPAALMESRERFCSATYSFNMLHLFRAKQQAAAAYGGLNMKFGDFETYAHSKCFYCGAAPSCAFSSHVKYGPKRRCTGTCPNVFYYNGLDRLDSDQGYELHNVVPCCGACNRAKRDRSVDQFVTDAHRLWANMDNWEEDIRFWIAVHLALHQPTVP